MSLKYQILAIGLTAFILVFLQPVYVQAFSCPDDPFKYYTKGLASTPNLGNDLKKTTDSKCIVDPKAAFAPYKIPTYEDLKSLYYTQSKATKLSSTNTNLAPITSTDDGKVFNYTTSTVNINGTYNYNGTAIIFIDGNLNIDQNINDNSADKSKGLVLVVKNNINIKQSVTQIDAVIISEGIICTAYTGSACLSATDTATSPRLTINGSLISINSNGSPAIKFRRRLADNSDPAEKIIHQPKYLVILRNLMSDTLQKWSEVQ